MPSTMPLHAFGTRQSGCSMHSMAIAIWVVPSSTKPRLALASMYVRKGQALLPSLLDHVWTTPRRVDLIFNAWPLCVYITW